MLDELLATFLLMKFWKYLSRRVGGYGVVLFCPNLRSFLVHCLAQNLPGNDEKYVFKALSVVIGLGIKKLFIGLAFV